MSFYLWLLPDEPHFSLLQHRISDLARCYETPVFLPHITLCSFSEKHNIKGFECAPMSIELLGPKHNPDFFTNIVHPIEHQELRATQLRLAQEHNGKAPPFPHLSLLYGNLHAGTGFDLCQGLGSQTIAIQCSKLVLIQGGPRVEDWMVVAQKDLA